MTCEGFNTTGCLWNNQCAPQLALESRGTYNSNTACCDYKTPDHLTTNNCCCTSYFYVADAVTSSKRNDTLAAGLIFYGLALLYLIYSFWNSQLMTRKATYADFFKSRRFWLYLVTLFSLLSGTASSCMHYFAFKCFGGDPATASCPGGPKYQAYIYLSAFIVMDAFSNVGFIVSKLTVLSTSLLTVQLGLDKSPDAPSVHILTFVVRLSAASDLCWIVAAIVGAGQLNRVAAEFQKVESAAQAAEYDNLIDLFLKIFHVLFIIAAMSLIIATLSTFLYIRHIAFHLKRYLVSLEKSNAFTADDENASTHRAVTGHLSKLNPFTKFSKSVSGNLRRLQLSVALIAISFLFKVTVYILLAIGFGSNDSNVVTCPYPEGSSAKVVDLSISTNAASSTNFFLCDGRYVPKYLIQARSLLGSPIVIPILVLMTDPFMIMCVYTITTTTAATTTSTSTSTSTSSTTTSTNTTTANPTTHV